MLLFCKIVFIIQYIYIYYINTIISYNVEVVVSVKVSLMKYWLIKNTCEGSFVSTKPPITLSTPLVLCMCTSKVDSSIIEERKRSIGKKQERELMMQKTLLAFFRDYWSSGRRSEWHFIRWRAVICQTLSCCSAAARTNRQEGREASTEQRCLFRGETQRWQINTPYTT